MSEAEPQSHEQVERLLFTLLASHRIASHRIAWHCSSMAARFYLGGPTRHSLENSHTNHNTQKRAEAWAPAIENSPDVDSWDFKKITAFSSRLNREIRKRSVGKLASRVVLPGALNLWRSGVSLLPYTTATSSIQPIL